MEHHQTVKPCLSYSCSQVALHCRRELSDLSLTAFVAGKTAAIAQAGIYRVGELTKTVKVTVVIVFNRIQRQVSCCGNVHHFTSKSVITKLNG